MSEDSGGHEAPTRRHYMKYGGTVVGGGLLAGCAGQSDHGSTPTETSVEDGSTATKTLEDESYLTVRLRTSLDRPGHLSSADTICQTSGKFS